MGITIFVSYATKDSNTFQIAKLAERLTKYPEIDNALYWEEDMHDDIYKYMEKNIGRCDVFLLFCSQNALNSEPIEMEWMAALKKKKKIIPIFIKEEKIPNLLSTRLGVQFRKEDVDGTIENIYQLILKNLIVSPKRPKKPVKKKEIVSFRSAQIPQFEADILQEIEKLTKRQFTTVNNFDFLTKMGFSTKSQRVIGIASFFCGLSILPESIGNLSSLKELNSSDNQLKTLPESIGDLKSLTYLNLNNNQVMTLPESIGNLTSLQTLCLFSNKLSTLPESITKLTSLETINFCANNLWTLPESIGNLSSLQKLYLDNNKFKALPESIGNLSSLNELNLSWNKLTILPESIGNLISLQVLYLRFNRLSTLPESIGNLASLQILHLNNNNLTTLPESIINLTSLKNLDISHNPLDSKAKSVIKQLKKNGVKVSK